MAVVGKPNVGKSTIVNTLVGQKVSIVSDKPQSTRDRVVGIRTTADVQMVVLDTPGLLNPRYELHRAMRATALRALAASGHFRLVETFADRIASLLINDFGAPWVKVSAAKLGILPNTKFVGVTIERRR